MPRTERSRDEINRSNRNWYHKSGYSKTKVLKNKNRRDKIRAWFESIKHELGCACGENHPSCIDFHHNDGSTKEYNISTMVNSGWSIKKILKEMEKCTPMCSNCHRKLHYNEDQTSIEAVKV